MDLDLEAAVRIIHRQGMERALDVAVDDIDIGIVPALVRYFIATSGLLHIDNLLLKLPLVARWICTFDESLKVDDNDLIGSGMDPQSSTSTSESKSKLKRRNLCHGHCGL